MTFTNTLVIDPEKIGSYFSLDSPVNRYFKFDRVDSEGFLKKIKLRRFQEEFKQRYGENPSAASEYFRSNIIHFLKIERKSSLEFNCINLHLILLGRMDGTYTEQRAKDIITSLKKYEKFL